MTASQSTIRPEHRVVLIKIPKSVPADGGAEATLDATRMWWVVGEHRRNRSATSPTHALAVGAGRVRAAYRIDRWIPAPNGPRWGFEGRLDDELNRMYDGMDVTAHYPPGAANPLRYINCEGGSTVADVPVLGDVDQVKRDDLVDIVQGLNLEPLTHLMLGHRELFHSNLLAWFFDRLPEAADEVFGPMTTTASTGHDREVRRERKNLDLWLRWPDRNPLVIENKVFSLPDEDQLTAYTDKAIAGGETPTLFLLSLSDPSWVDDMAQLGGHEWRWLSYRDLAARIRSAMEGASPSYEVDTMWHYADVVDLLSDLVDSVIVGDDDEPVALPIDVVDALGDDRLASTMAKLRARSVAGRISRALTEAGVSNTDVESGLTNTQPSVAWFGPVDRAARGLHAGWQWQGGHFRLAIITPHLDGRTERKRQQRFDFALANADLFDFSLVDDDLGTGDAMVRPGVTLSKPHGFNRYDPDFVYRSKPAHEITVAQLVTAAVRLARR